MEKVQDLNTSNSSGNLVAEDDEKMKNLLTQKLDEVVDSEIKKVGVQKMEDDLTIKMLEREYLETKRNLIYSKQKLEEAKKKAAAQSQMINQLLHANKAIIEKFDELKRFQNEVILTNIMNAEKTFVECKNKNLELDSVLQAIINRENYSENLNKEMSNRKNQANIEIHRQIEEQRTKYNKFNEDFKQLEKSVEILRQQLEKEKKDQMPKNTTEELQKRVIQLEADEEIFQKQFKQEIDKLQNEKNKCQNLEANKRNIEEKKSYVQKLQLELSSIQKQSAPNTDLEDLQTKKDELLKEVIRKRDIDDMAQIALKENIENIKIEQKKVDQELEEAKNTFSKTEEELRIEFDTLYVQVKEKVQLQNKLESSQQYLNKLKKNRHEKQKEASNDQNYLDQLKESESQIKKYEQMNSISIKKQDEFNSKLQEIYKKRDEMKQKLESMIAKQNNTNKINNTCKETHLDDSSSTSKKKNILESQEHKLVQENLHSSQTTREEQAKKYVFNFDSSDESDDDFDLVNIEPKMPIQTSQKKPVYSCDWIDKRIEESKNQPSTSDLFDKILSQKPSSRNQKDKDLFKIPQTYITPTRKKSSQVRKY